MPHPPRPPAGGPHAQSVRTLAAATLRIGLRFGAVAGLTALLVAVALAGLAGLAGAAVGVAIGFGSSLLTMLLMRIAAPLPVQALFAVVMGGYAVKVGLLLALVAPLSAATTLHPMALGFSMLAVVIAWAVAGMVAFQRTPILTVIPAEPPPPPIS